MSLIYNLTFSFKYSLPVIKPLIFFLLLCRRRNMWGSCWCGNVLRQQHATVASEWRHTLYPPPPQPTASQRLSEALKLPGAWLALDRHYCLFLRFSSHSGSLLMPAETFRGAIVWLPFHIYICVCVIILYVCVTACAALCENIVVPRVRISSYLLKAERLLWAVRATPRNVFWPVSNPEAWPAQTIKGLPTVILALSFHYGSAAAGAQISSVGLLRKLTGTDSITELKQEPQGSRWAGFIESVLAGNRSFWFSIYL